MTKRLKLKNWIRLARIQKEIKEGIDVPKLIFEALSLSSSDPINKNLPWFDVSDEYFELLSENNPTIDFPILRGSKKEKSSPAPWEYEGREWYFWLHLFSSRYGWDVDTVSELDIDDAFGLLQEIRTEEQLTREWEHSLSEISWEYNKAMKKSVYKPIKRPSWMNELSIKVSDQITRRMPKKFIPPGVIIKSNVDENKNTESE